MYMLGVIVIAQVSDNNQTDISSEVEDVELQLRFRSGWGKKSIKFLKLKEKALGSEWDRISVNRNGILDVFLD